MNGISIILPDRIAPSSLAYDGEHYYACDGFRTQVFSFNSLGKADGEYCTVRPYRTIRYDPYSEGYVALGSGCTNTVYFLDDSFVELGAVCPYSNGETAKYIGVSREGAMLDITYDSSIIRCNRNGEYHSTVSLSGSSASFLGYDEHTEGYAKITDSNGNITLSTATGTVTLPDCTVFRGFLPFSSDISVALGQNYLYTYICDVSLNGNERFSFVSRENFGINYGSCCCNRIENGV